MFNLLCFRAVCIEEKCMKKIWNSNGHEIIQHFLISVAFQPLQFFLFFLMLQANTIAALTKQFLQTLSRNALEASKKETSLEYGDLAELVDKSERLAPLKTLIPKKITFREFIRLNRPTKFTSFI